MFEEIKPPPFEFDQDEKIFCACSEEDDDALCTCEKYSYNEWLQRIKNMSGVNPDLLGPACTSKN